MKNTTKVLLALGAAGAGYWLYNAYKKDDVALKGADSDFVLPAEDEMTKAQKAVLRGWFEGFVVDRVLDGQTDVTAEIALRKLGPTEQNLAPDAAANAAIDKLVTAGFIVYVPNEVFVAAAENNAAKMPDKTTVVATKEVKVSDLLGAKGAKKYGISYKSGGGVV